MTALALRHLAVASNLEQRAQPQKILSPKQSSMAKPTKFISSAVSCQKTQMQIKFLQSWNSLIVCLINQSVHSLSKVLKQIRRSLNYASKTIAHTNWSKLSSRQNWSRLTAGNSAKVSTLRAGKRCKDAVGSLLEWSSKASTEQYSRPLQRSISILAVCLQATTTPSFTPQL